MQNEIEKHRVIYVKLLKIYRTICINTNRFMFETKTKPRKCKACGERIEA